MPNAKKAYELTLKARPYQEAKRTIVRATQRGSVSVDLGSLPFDTREMLKQEGYKLKKHGYRNWEVSWDRSLRWRWLRYARGTEG